MAVPARVGTPVPIAMVLEDGNTGQFPQAEVYLPGTSAPVYVFDLDHRAKGRYELLWSPPMVGVYTILFIVYADPAHTVENITYSREIEQIFVTSSSVDDLAAKIARVLGLVHENAFIDNTVFDAMAQLTSCRIRIYDSKIHAEAATDGGSETLGLIGVYQMSATYEGAGKLGTYRYLKVG